MAPLKAAACCVLLAAIGTANAPSSHAQKKVDNRQKTEPQELSPLAARDPAAIALRDRMLRAYRDLNAVHEKISQRQWKTNPEDALTVDVDLRFRRPNRLYLAIDYPYVDKAGRWQLIYACDGKTLTVYNSARNEYQAAKAPARLDRLVLPQALRGPEIVALLRDTSPFDLLEKTAVVRYGEAVENTTEGEWHTLKLDLQQDGAKRILRYRLGLKDNLVHGFTLAIVPDADTGNPFADPEVRSNVEAKYTVVDTNPRFADADFRFSLPAGAKEQKPDRRVPEGTSRKSPATEIETPR